MTDTNKGFRGLKSLASNESLESTDTPEINDPSITKVNPEQNRHQEKNVSSIHIEPDNNFLSKISFQTKITTVIIGLIIFLIIFDQEGESKSDNTKDELSLVESTPIIGTDHVHNASEILYCLAEESRIEAQRESLDSRDLFSVKIFNVSTDDYNSRCASYKYKDSQYRLAEKVFLQNKDLYKIQGSSR